MVYRGGRWVQLIAETSEYKKLRRDSARLQEEKRALHDKSEEMIYDLFWKGEMPSYDEYKKAMAQISLDSIEKEGLLYPSLKSD